MSKKKKSRIRFGISCNGHGTWNVVDWKNPNAVVKTGSLNDVIDFLNITPWTHLIKMNCMGFEKQFENAARTNCSIDRRNVLNWIYRSSRVSYKDALTKKQKVERYEVHDNWKEISARLANIPSDYTIRHGVPVNMSHEYFAAILTIEIDNVNRVVTLNYDI